MKTRLFISIFLIISFLACDNLEQADSAANLNGVVSELGDSPNSGQNNSHTSVLVGNIGKNNISMEVRLVGDKISGKYRSPLAQTELLLEGEINRQQQNRFEIREFDQEGNQVGAFRGSIDLNQRYRGEWANKQGNLHAPFELETRKEVFMLSKPAQRTNRKIEVEYRTAKLEAPDKKCQIIDHYPVFSGFNDPVIEKNINQLLKPAPLFERQTSLNQCAEQLQDLEFEEGAKTVTSTSINLINPQILSITSHQSLFDPETQKSQIFSHVINIDAETGSRLSNEDLFTLNHSEKLNTLIKQKFSEKYEHDWGLVFEGIKPEKSLAFYADRVLLTFNPYELGDYAPGQILVSFSYQELADLINPNGPLSGMMSFSEPMQTRIEVE